MGSIQITNAPKGERRCGFNTKHQRTTAPNLSGICGHLGSRSKVMRLPTEILTWNLAPRYPQDRLPSMVRRLKEARAFDCSTMLCQKHTPPNGVLPRLSLLHTCGYLSCGTSLKSLEGILSYILSYTCFVVKTQAT